MEQTAVEFAVEQLEQLIPSGHQLAIRAILEQAKEMEKQQIIDARVKKPLQSEWDEAEQYYNEQFKNK
jgi:bisphosphoglycerate-dependent phosphoglycerate mutase